MDRSILLSIRDLHAFYTGPDNLALGGVNISVNPDKIVALIGPNGAGKSTVLKAIFKEAKVNKGEILFEDADITRLRADSLAKLGIGFIPEGRRLFGSLTVEENLDMGGYIFKDKEKLTANKERVFELFPFLFGHRYKLAKELSGGEQQMVAFGRALMLNPKLLLMDEPSLGLAPQMTDRVFDMIKTIVGTFGVSVLLVEQNVKKAMEIAHKVYVLNLGRVAFEGTPKALLETGDLKRTYLGVSYVGTTVPYD